MRIRTVKPEFYQHQGIASLPRDVRFFAIGLLNWADDYGYFLAHPALIAGAVVPFDSDGKKFVETAIKKLVEIGYIELSNDGRGRLPGFPTHQVVNKKSKARLSVNPWVSLNSGSTTVVVLESPGGVQEKPRQEVGSRSLEVGSRKWEQEAREVFAHWVSVMGSKAVESKDRLDAIIGRLSEGFTVADLKAAIYGCSRTPHNMGANDRGTKYNDIELICRNAQNVERFMSAKGPQATKPEFDPNGGILRHSQSKPIDTRTPEQYWAEKGVVIP